MPVNVLHRLKSVKHTFSFGDFRMLIDSSNIGSHEVADDKYPEFVTHCQSHGFSSQSFLCIVLM